ncbi:MAG: hypothetical protein WDA14_12720 [Sphaerochaetaceae bacterium]
MFGQARTDHCHLIIRFASKQATGAVVCGQEFLDHLQHLDEGAVLVGHISFENLLDVVGNAENHLATAQDFCYAFHGPAFLLCVCGKSHYIGLSGPFPYILPDLGLFQTILCTQGLSRVLGIGEITKLLLFCKRLYR